MKKPYILLLVLTLSTNLSAFSLRDIPKIKNKKEITITAESGFWTKHLEEQLLPKFTKKTGVKVKVASMSLTDLYKKQNFHLKNFDNQYDLITIEASWAKEFAAKGYIVPLENVIIKYDPSGIVGLEKFVNNFYKSLLTILKYNNKYYSIPYNNYTMSNHYRADLFESKVEQDNFRKLYGYKLVVPSNIQQLLDVAKFFTRKKGELLAGTKLKHDFYGITLMAGNKPHINDEFTSLLWGIGGTWFSPKYDKFKNLKEFKILEDNVKLKYIGKLYLQLLDYSYPVDKNFGFMQAATAFNQGSVAMWPFAYNNLWSVSAKVQNNVKNAKIGIDNAPLGKPYAGAHAFAIAYDSLNPEASYWLLKYLTSFEGQFEYAKGGGSPCRQDVVLHSFFMKPENHLISGAFLQSHDSNLKLISDIKHYGLYNSTIMGKIYSECTKTSFNIATKEGNINDIVNNFNQVIFNLQNTYGEYPAIIGK